MIVHVFDYRRQQAWPPTVHSPRAWESLYEEASVGLDVLPSLEQAVLWVNEFVQRIDASGISTSADA